MTLSIPTRQQVAAARVLVVGDAMLDRYWHGAVDRISPEAPVPVVRVTREEERIGAAANVAYNVVTLGAPAQAILKAASALGSDLVVVGTHGLGGARKLFFGSTTEQLLRRTSIPVLAVPSPPTPGARKPARDWPGPCLVVPTDLGTTSRADAGRAGDVARAFGADLLFVHVIASIQPPSWYRSDLRAHYRIAAAHARQGLEALQQAAGAGVAAECRVLVGRPADEIAALAAARRTGLIVLVLRSRAGLLGPRPGAIAYHILSHGVAPVLALPPSTVRRAVRPKR